MMMMIIIIISKIRERMIVRHQLNLNIAIYYTEVDAL